MDLGHEFQADIDAVSRIDAVPAILEVVCRITGMGFAAVARVTEDRWVACAVRDEIAFGMMSGGELKIETTICSSIRTSGLPVIIDHVAEDDDYRDHHIPAMYGFQSYVSVPILLPGGKFFGTLCAIDPRPASVKRSEIAHMFRLFADLIAFHLEASERVEASEAALASERRTADLRDQFIAVLGHDLRNPLASIDAAAHMLLKEKPEPKAASVLGVVRQSVTRMSELIDNVLDFAQGRLGGGLSLAEKEPAWLGPTLGQVVEELRGAWPGRTISLDLDLDSPVACDPARIAQLLSNLVGNALTHGSAAPVRVAASTREGMFVLSVANEGEPIPPAVQERLFQPFFRATRERGHRGLGLGLYIASEIARAHDGTLEVASDAEGTRFTLRMPLA